MTSQPKANITTETPHYNTENGDWDGQLPNPDLVVQPDPPLLQPKIFDRLARADSVVRARRYRGSTAAVFHRMTVRAGTKAGCYESVDSMASGLGISRSSVQRAISTISKDGYMIVEERPGKTYLCHPVFTQGGVTMRPHGVSPCDPMGGVMVTPKGNPSSSREKVRERTTKTVDQKKQETTKRTRTTKTEKSLEEEKTTGTRKAAPAMAHAEAVDAWIETNMPASPTASFASAMLKHYKKHWWKPDVSYGWDARQTIAGATKVYMGDLKTWHQLRVDLRDKMLVGGLPPDLDHQDGKPKLKGPVICEYGDHQGDKLTMAYGEQTTVFRRIEGPDVIDKCDECLSRQPVGVN